MVERIAKASKVPRHGEFKSSRRDIKAISGRVHDIKLEKDKKAQGIMCI